MPKTESSHASGEESNPSLNGWLRFDPKTRHRYEIEHGAERIAALRAAIYTGLVLYNAYNLTSIVLLHDILGLSVVLRVLLVTPIALALAWSIRRLPSHRREPLVLAALMGAYFVPVFLFWLTSEPLGAFTFGEFSLTLIFGNMLLPLRFRHAVVFTCSAFVVTLVAIFAKSELDPMLRLAFTVQIATACLFSLYANYRTERRRCLDYLTSLRARLDAEAAEAARKQFQDLSRTDALTGLPNRRLLTERMDEWFSEDTPIAVMMIDIDHFKLFNDVLGHPAGDDCLRSVAALFIEISQGRDIVCARFGGEEFTVAVKGADELTAARLARRITQAVEGLAIVHPGRSDGIGVVTVSVGVAFKQAGRAASQAATFEAADRALYEAKRRGRNCFVMDRKLSASAIMTGAG
ncbi:GGDEF domain-containing protein [Sphingopyxis kveilinensis]|uniref:GGDEF domain-containing protein n=1 Tax=Sphingopyxis kveilinensis TaxID=3114367 RepID=UPI0030D11079